MEDYLLEQNGIIENKEYLTKEEDIENYFEGDGREYFDCGQGYCEEEVDVICKIGDKFYEVTLTAEITSAKQDYGARLYWVERICDVSYKEIKRPLLMEKSSVQYDLTFTDNQQELLEDFMKENNILFKR